MDWKRIFKRGKNEKPESNPSRAARPSPGTSIRSASPTPVSSVAPSALVFQPLVPLPTLPPSENRQAEIAVAGIDTWTNLTAFVDFLHQTPLPGPLVAVIDDLSWFIRAHDDVASTQKEYKELRTHLEELFKNLRAHLSGNTSPAMTTSMLNLCEAIQTEMRQAYGTQDRSVISRYMQANQDLDKITGCYRRIQGHLERVMVRDS
ncbi:hypothetical protein RSAG8_12221, partial [Rhizoctonia solani AG-8 WAC10335]